MKNIAGWCILACGVALTVHLSSLLPAERVHAQAARSEVPPNKKSPTALGGPRGAVKRRDGRPVEGVMVQMIAKSTSIRTTVYTNAGGLYEFPSLEAGQYTLRLARPMEFAR